VALIRSQGRLIVRNSLNSKQASQTYLVYSGVEIKAEKTYVMRLPSSSNLCPYQLIVGGSINPMKF
jgi:hypothetical protein